MAATVAPSCRAVLTQANTLWPNRSRASDGTIGDTRHQATKSDHNPDRNGIVHAVDLTHDPAHGCDAHKLAREIAARRDPRVAYIISNGQICSSKSVGGKPPWTWRTYTGSNKHIKHMHISIHHTEKARHDTSPWFPRRQTAPTPSTPGPTFIPIKIGDDSYMRVPLDIPLHEGLGYNDIPGKTPDDVVAIVVRGPDPADFPHWDSTHLHEPEVAESDPDTHTARIVLEADTPVSGNVRVNVTVSGS